MNRFLCDRSRAIENKQQNSRLFDAELTFAIVACHLAKAGRFDSLAKLRQTCRKADRLLHLYFDMINEQEWNRWTYRRGPIKMGERFDGTRWYEAFWTKPTHPFDLVYFLKVKSKGKKVLTISLNVAGTLRIQGYGEVRYNLNSLRYLKPHNDVDTHNRDRLRIRYGSLLSEAVRKVLRGQRCGKVPIIPRVVIDNM